MSIFWNRAGRARTVNGLGSTVAVLLTICIVAGFSEARSRAGDSIVDARLEEMNQVLVTQRLIASLAVNAGNKQHCRRTRLATYRTEDHGQT
ncbi:MAG: hypothetical protein AAGC70_17595 [Pseudomonadota bacterium]